jgi:hypothetical protein
LGIRKTFVYGKVEKFQTGFINNLLMLL